MVNIATSGVFVPGQLLLFPKEAVLDPLPKYLLCALLYSVTKSSKDVVADHPWMQCSDYFVMDNIVYMGTVNNSYNA